MLVEFWRRLRALIGPEECAVYLALALLAYGLWLVWQPGAFLAPAAVMLWMYIPQRRAFFEKRPVELDAHRQRRAG